MSLLSHFASVYMNMFPSIAWTLISGRVPLLSSFDALLPVPMPAHTSRVLPTLLLVFEIG
jgi:hypothetical protein